MTTSGDAQRPKTAEVGSTARPAKPRRNWWKWAFFVALIGFEFAREAAVVASNERPSMSVGQSVNQYAHLISAQGSWVRTDGGDQLVPSITRIRCDSTAGECTETDVTTYKRLVFAPDTSTFPARFGPNAVEYQKDFPCNRYFVRIDTRLKRAEQVRERKENTTDALGDCDVLDQRIEMRLADGREAEVDPMKGHFLPFFSLGRAVFGAL